MRNSKIGKRVGAVMSMEDGVLNLFGYGVYEGDFVPETDDVRFMGMSLKELGHENPRILLDSGKYVWGCECWWSSEEEVQAQAARAKSVNIVDIEEMRKQSNAAQLSD